MLRFYYHCISKKCEYASIVGLPAHLATETRDFRSQKAISRGPQLVFLVARFQFLV